MPKARRRGDARPNNVSAQTSAREGAAPAFAAGRPAMLASMKWLRKSAREMALKRESYGG